VPEGLRKSRLPRLKERNASACTAGACSAYWTVSICRTENALHWINTGLRQGRHKAEQCGESMVRLQSLADLAEKNLDRSCAFARKLLQYYKCSALARMDGPGFVSRLKIGVPLAAKVVSRSARQSLQRGLF
jgi:hypothetical protein